jgi:integrase/recombinase XerC
MNPSHDLPAKEKPENLLEQKPYEGFLLLCKSPNTQESYHKDLRVLKRFLDESDIPTPMDAKPEQMIRFAGSLTKPGTTPGGKPRTAYSTRSMKRILAATRSFYRYLASIQSIQNDPTAVFHNLAIRSPQRNPHPLPPRDRQALVKGLQTGDWESRKISLVVLLGFHCGLRVSEICHLRVRDLDLHQGLVTVIGKGDKERTIPMTEALKELLKSYLGQRHEKTAVYLFPSPRSASKPIHPDYLETWVKKAAQWAHLEHPEEMTVHVLRHSFGTQLAESGASVYEIRDLMGHSSITVSENYVKLASTQARQAHQRAFEKNLVLHPLRMGAFLGVASVLNRFRNLPGKR